MTEIDPQLPEDSTPAAAQAPAPAPASATAPAGEPTIAYSQPAPPVPPVQTVRTYRGLLIGGAAAIALGIGATGVGVGEAIAGFNNTSSSSQAQGPTRPGSSGQGYGNGYGNGNGNRYGFGTFGGRQAGRTAVNATAATAAQQVGVVTVVSTLDYDPNSEAAGTGIIYSSNGEIVTNNHVVQGSTSIKVTVESTGKTYTAQVVGTDATDDIAVLQLVDSNGDKVTGLTAATLDTHTLATGATVTSIGNAEGTGNLVAAAGAVTALDQSIHVANDATGATESLSGLIETNADVVSGDSGGPLIDARGEVAGVVTAASSGARNVTGYAIPINTAVSIAKQIIAGHTSSTITIGLPAFLGVELASAQASSGVTISGVITGSAADGTGLVAGDVITAVDGQAVISTDSLSALVTGHAVGDKITLTYTDASGASHQVTVTLTGGPAA